LSKVRSPPLQKLRRRRRLKKPAKKFDEEEKKSPRKKRSELPVVEEIDAENQEIAAGETRGLPKETGAGGEKDVAEIETAKGGTKRTLRKRGKLVERKRSAGQKSHRSLLDLPHIDGKNLSGFRVNLTIPHPPPEVVGGEGNYRGVITPGGPSLRTRAW